MGLLESLFETFRGGSPRMQEAGIGEDQTDTVRKIVKALDQLEPEQARYIATFAYILGRVAHADMEISEVETATMERMIVDRGGLPPEQAVIAVQIAKTQNTIFGGTEDFLVTREFSALSTRDQKLALLECMYAVSASDDSVSTIEDNEIGKIVNELRLSHAELNQARESYREYLAVLRREDESDGS